jgi:asparagine synthase (glutamine-hydrolysing)
MAAFTGSDYTPVRVSAQDMADVLEEAVWHGERPFFNANVTAKYLLSRAVRAAGIKVVLTGEGADEMFAGYQTEQRDKAIHDGGSSPEARAAIASLLSNPAVRAFMFHEGKSAPGIEAVHALLGYVPSFIELFSVQYQAVFELMRTSIPGYCDSSVAYNGLLNTVDIRNRLAGRDIVNQSLYLWQKSMLVNYVLTVLGDRMEMSHSVEGRVPYLDHKVAEYAAALPIRFKIRGGVEKYILREAGRDVVTPELYARPKHPFFAPPLRQKRQGILADPMQMLCEDVIRSSAFADQPFFDPSAARAFLDRAALGQIPADIAAAATMRMATLSIMQKRFSIA